MPSDMFAVVTRCESPGVPVDRCPHGDLDALSFIVPEALRVINCLVSLSSRQLQLKLWRKSRPCNRPCKLMIHIVIIQTGIPCEKENPEFVPTTPRTPPSFAQNATRFAQEFSAKVRDVETATGLTLFPQLPFAERSRLELRIHSDVWPLT